MKSENLNFLEPSGNLQAVTGLLYPLFVAHEINNIFLVPEAACYHLLLNYSSLDQAVSQRLVQSWARSEQIELFRRMPSQYWAAVITGPLILVPSNKRCPA